jgi:hypothetical protein
MARKAIHKSRTNQTVAAIVGVVAAKALAHYLPPEIAEVVGPALTDEVVGAAVAVLGAAAVRFRQLANAPEDRQGEVTPRPG